MVGGGGVEKWRLKLTSAKVEEEVEAELGNKVSLVVCKSLCQPSKQSQYTLSPRSGVYTQSTPHSSPQGRSSGECKQSKMIDTCKVAGYYHNYLDYCNHIK